MGFVGLQEALRRELRRRIASGELTGMELARKTGFTQAHISNFVNRKRGLKLSALDRMTKAIGLTIYDLLDPRELGRYIPLPATDEGEFADVPLINPGAALSPIVVREQVQELLKFRQAFLSRLRTPAASERKDWTRFVALQMDSSQAAAMWPEAGARVTVLVDRHYASLEPYRPGKRNIYMIQSGGSVIARYIDSADGGLVLQPRDSAFPVNVLPAGATACIVGRVAQASLKA